MSRCRICNRFLDNPYNPIPTKDCGGDCLECMADAGDPECIASLEEDRRTTTMLIDETENMPEGVIKALMDLGYIYLTESPRRTPGRILALTHEHAEDRCLQRGLGETVLGKLEHIE